MTIKKAPGLRTNCQLAANGLTEAADPLIALPCAPISKVFTSHFSWNSLVSLPDAFAIVSLQWEAAVHALDHMACHGRSKCVSQDFGAAELHE